MVNTDRIMKNSGAFIVFLIVVAAFVFDFSSNNAIGNPDDDDYQMAPD